MAVLSGSFPCAGAPRVPVQNKSLTLSNSCSTDPYVVRTEHLIAMAPMTRAMRRSVPRLDVSRYYRRRAEGGSGLSLPKGTCHTPHRRAGTMKRPPHPRDDALKPDGGAWFEASARAGGRSFCTLWHSGSSRKPRVDAWGISMDWGPVATTASALPAHRWNGLPLEGREATTTSKFRGAIEAYGAAAYTAKALVVGRRRNSRAHFYRHRQFSLG